jgi:hypothetical protein
MPDLARIRSEMVRKMVTTGNNRMIKDIMTSGKQQEPVKITFTYTEERQYTLKNAYLEWRCFP